MEDNKKIFIRGSKKHGDKVIEYLRELSNRDVNSNWNGDSVSSIYFLDHNNIICCIEQMSEMAKIVMDCYTEVTIDDILVYFAEKEDRWEYDGEHTIKGYWILSDANLAKANFTATRNSKNVFATKKQAKSALAMAQISQYMANDKRYGGAVTDEEWKDYYSIKYVISRYGHIGIRTTSNKDYQFLAFHTEEQRDLFLKEHEDLVKDYLKIKVMKELSIEDKAKRYDEAIEIARDVYTYYCDDREQLRKIESIFPELKESEDKRIKNVLIGWINLEPSISFNDTFDGFSKEQILAWLEKQDSYCTKRDVDDAYLKGVIDTKNEIEKQYKANYQIRKEIATFIFNYKGDIKDRAKWMDYLGIEVSFAEKQGEWHSAWSEADEECKIGKWFTGLIPCWINAPSTLQSAHVFHGKNVVAIHLKGGGYKCCCVDDKKPIVFNVAENTPFEEGWHNRESSAWSEEDEDNLKDVVWAVEEIYDKGSGEEELVKWIKSLKDRYTWKPSNEQIKVCKEVYADILSAKGFDLGTVNGELNRLEEELKKLRKE